ncbi:FHA domain-containing protein [Kribbella antibiotica]|uniref:FHA domain-containing protein n=1 Tax=Kribbella antibiotica TaxID=190195 RepID=A0A4R4Z914_9ACTN|nr:FHA domain-containing protein [Kribbella antibiotica]TDD54456.1 FHA domain-containing protein [Kribbella antibiotica]
MEPVKFNQVRSLRHFPTEPQPGALSVLTVSENLVVPPGPDAELSFGRNRLAVDLCVGENDVRISRLHGTITYRDGHWWLRNHGRLPIRVSTGVLLHTGSEPLPLANGYTTIFLRGNRQREHLLEVLISDGEDRAAQPRPNQLTLPPKRWRLTPEEHLTLTVLAQRYLAYDLQPLPLTRSQAAAELAELRPQETWTAKRVEHIVSRLRQRLSDAGVSGLRRDEVGEPVGLTLTVNLIWELVQSTTLVPMDLEWLELAGQDPTD